ncbi:MAG: Na+/H+ antiporter subunit A [Clostridia bacterium]|nr:Na+/H+ antiporter subunit A [Clostridia bacterium]
MSELHLTTLMPFVYTLVVPFFYKYIRRIHTGWFVLPLPILLFVYLIKHISLVARGKPIIHSVPWIPSLGINYTINIDGLALIFGLIISGIGALVVLYSIYYLSKDREALQNFYVYLLLFMGAMLAVVFSDNIIVLYLFWELTSISSFLLIAYWYQRKSSRYGAQKALLITMFGGFLMLGGFLLLANVTGTFSIGEMILQAGKIKEHPVFLPAMLLILLGAFTKSAQFPFHIWLPDAMEAPTPISAYLHSATMVKAGIYLIARFTPIFGGNMAWFWAVSGIGLFTLFWGAFSAIRQRDLKAVLAYSTVSQLGMITCLLGLGSVAMYYGPGESSALYTSAILAAIFHLLNHSTFKGCLFMVVGIIDHQTGTRDIRRLGGLMNLMPVTFTLAVIGSFSMAGLPPFNGFLSKEMFFTSVLNASHLDIFHMETWGIMFPVIAWTASVFTFIYCMIIVFKTFTGKYHPQKLERKINEASWGLLLPPALLALLVVLFFFFPNVLARYLLIPAMASVLPDFGKTGFVVDPIEAWHGWTPELLMTIGIVAIGTLMFVYLRKWISIYARLPVQFSLNNMYDQLLVKTEAFSARLTRAYMTGFVRDYLLYIFAFFVVVLGGIMLFLDTFAYDPAANNPISIYEIILALAMVVCALMVLFARTRLVAIIGVGVMGYLVAMFFVVFRAPDLALTQLVVETVTTVLFLLCFYFLPELKEEAGSIGLRATNLAVAAGVGVIVTAMALSAQGNRLFAPISWFFENSYELAGAKNIVNAILVDFRGFDTMFEILVFSIAGLGVYTLIKLLTRRDQE